MENNVSITAYWMAAYRALEFEKTTPLFHDPYATLIANPVGFNFLRKLRFGLSSEWLFNTRTKVIDNLITELVKNEKIDVVLNLAAGFDMRPFRLELDSNLKWIEIDHDEIIQQKNQLNYKIEPRCILQRISCDLNQTDHFDTLISKLEMNNLNVLLITEGLLIYLTHGQVSNLAKTLSSIKSKKTLWIFDGAHPLVIALFGLIWNPRLSQSNCRFTSGIFKDNLSRMLAYKFNQVRFESLFIQAKHFKKAPLSLKILYLSSRLWLKPIRNWYFGLSGIYLVDKSK